MGFEIGKFYQHNSGNRMAIVGQVETTMYGKTLVAECSNMSDLKPVGSDEDATAGWSEISKGKWLSCFSGDNNTPPKFSEPVLALAIPMPSGHVYTIEPVAAAIREVVDSGRKVYGYFTNDLAILDSDQALDPNLISHEITRWRVDYRYLIVEVNILNTPAGKLLWDYMQDDEVDFQCVCKVESKPYGDMEHVTYMAIHAIHAIPKVKNEPLQSTL